MKTFKIVSAIIFLQPLLVHSSETHGNQTRFWCNPLTVVKGIFGTVAFGSGIFAAGSYRNSRNMARKITTDVYSVADSHMAFIKQNYQTVSSDAEKLGKLEEFCKKGTCHYDGMKAVLTDPAAMDQLEKLGSLIDKFVAADAIAHCNPAICEGSTYHSDYQKRLQLEKDEERRVAAHTSFVRSSTLCAATTGIFYWLNRPWSRKSC